MARGSYRALTGPYQLVYVYEGTPTADQHYGPSGWKGQKLYLANDHIAAETFRLLLIGGSEVITLDAGEHFDEELDIEAIVPTGSPGACRIWIFGRSEIA